MTSDRVHISKVLVDDEIEALVLSVLRSGQLAQGPVVAELERDFAALCGVRHAIAVANGTIALEAAAAALELGPGDEIITSPFTFAATANAMLHTGATVLLADIDPETFTLDPRAVEALIGPRTKAIVPVHLYGQCADMTAFGALAERHGLALIEDAAQAHGATWKGEAAGSFGVGCFSLYATKNLTSGEGGLVTTDDDALAARLRLLRNQGMSRRYHYELTGHNWRLTDLQAAVAVPQLRRLAERTELRRRNAAHLSAALHGLPGLVTPTTHDAAGHVFHQYTVRVTAEAPLDRDRLAAALDARGIDSGVYYPKLVGDDACYGEHPNLVVEPTPHAAQAAREVLSLPVHPALEPAALDRVAEAVRAAFAEAGGAA